MLRSKATGLGLPSYDAPASVTSVRRMASRPTRSRAVWASAAPGRERLHRWVLWIPNLIIKQFGGTRAVVAVPESDAP